MAAEGGAGAEGGPPGPGGTDAGRRLCEEILTPEFFEKHWERFPLHHRASEHEKKANLLPEALSVDDMQKLVAISGSSLKMFKRGVPSELDDFQLAYLDGATMIVNQADRCNETLFDMCKVLADRHFLHVFSVVYLTPADSQAVRLHNDDQDVFLLQVWGRKNWTIWNAPQLLPYTEEMLGKETPVDPELISEEPTMRFVMEPHDVLYIPRGFLHEATTGEEPSLHITITVPTSDYCWGVQLTKHLMQKLQSKELSGPLAGLCGASMSRAGEAGPQAISGEDLDGQLQEIVSTWAKSLRFEDVMSSFEEKMARTNDWQERQFKHNTRQRMRPMVREDTRVRLMTGVCCQCEPDSEVAIFSRPDGQRMEMKISRWASALVRGLTSKPQWVTDLPCEDGFARICVLQMLHEQGVVQLFLKGPEDVEER